MYEALQSLFEEYGYYQEGLRSLTLKGKEGAELIQKTLGVFRTEPVQNLGELKVTAVEDYLTGVRLHEGNKEEKIDLPSSNVIKYYLEDGSWMCLRPSGTEPKIKFYFGVNDKSYAESRQKLQKLEQDFMKLVEEKMEAAKSL